MLTTLFNVLVGGVRVRLIGGGCSATNTCHCSGSRWDQWQCLMSYLSLSLSFCICLCVCACVCALLCAMRVFSCASTHRINIQSCRLSFCWLFVVGFPVSTFAYDECSKTFTYCLVCAMLSLERIVALLPWCSSVCPWLRPSVCLSGMGVPCDYTMHFSADLSLWLDSPMFWAPWH